MQHQFFWGKYQEKWPLLPRECRLESYLLMEDRECQPTIKRNSIQRGQGDLTPNFSSLMFPLFKCLAPHLFLNRFNPLLKNPTKTMWFSLRNRMIPRHPFNLNVKFCFKEYQYIIRLNYKSRNERGRIYLRNAKETRERCIAGVWIKGVLAGWF